MLFTTQKKKTLLFLVIFLIAGTAASSIRLLSQKDPFCNEYDDYGQCCRCAYRYYFNRHTKLCTQVSDFCETWDEKTGYCLTCFPSYGHPINGVCSPNPITEGGAKNCDCDCNCQTFNNHKECVKCFKGYEFNAHKVCVAISTKPPVVERPVHKPDLINNCLKYSYFDIKGKYYGQWFDGCKSACVECVKGYYLVKGICVALPPYCEVVDIRGKCTQCCKGYKLSYGKCAPIVVAPGDNCAKYGYVDFKGKWFSKWADGCKKVCKECVQGYYLNVDYECLALPRYCAAADVYGQCTECKKGYKLTKAGKCVKLIVAVPPVAENCLEYSYIDLKGKYHNKWTDECKKVCIVCKKGYELYEGKCLPCEYESDSVENDNPYCVERDDHGECCKCAYRTYMNKYGICIPVSDYCEAWNEKTGDCTCCYEGYTLVRGECVLAH